jgi:thioredoxin-like negative regulator of GroEL
MRPVVAGLVSRYAGRVDIKVLDTSTGDASVNAMAQRFGVDYVPTFIFLDSQGRRQDSVVGAVAESELTSRLDRLH